ncbi:MAG: hypothetical protein ACT6RL_08255 [Neoaquamicrobium sediminum]|uniref:hypothetical protein n=1 Tax=Neoaquamicrobium sediminum TaxID=1849104 RepID=UPI0040372162
MSVLISEVAGAGRWSQFNLKLDWVPIMFGGAASTVSQITLCSLDANGNVTDTYNQNAMYKPNSKNWAFEIPGASDLAFPGKQNRPILVVSQAINNHYPFELLMPNDTRYNSVAAFLAANRQTKAHHLARCIVPRANLPAGLFGLYI